MADPEPRSWRGVTARVVPVARHVADVGPVAVLQIDQPITPRDAQGIRDRWVGMTGRPCVILGSPARFVGLIAPGDAPIFDQLAAERGNPLAA